LINPKTKYGYIYCIHWHKWHLCIWSKSYMFQGVLQYIRYITYSDIFLANFEELVSWVCCWEISRAWWFFILFDSDGCFKFCIITVPFPTKSPINEDSCRLIEPTSTRHARYCESFIIIPLQTSCHDNVRFCIKSNCHCKEFYEKHLAWKYGSDRYVTHAKTTNLQILYPYQKHGDHWFWCSNRVKMKN